MSEDDIKTSEIMIDSDGERDEDRKIGVTNADGVLRTVAFPSKQTKKYVLSSITGTNGITPQYNEETGILNLDGTGSGSPGNYSPSKIQVTAPITRNVDPVTNVLTVGLDQSGLGGSNFTDDNVKPGFGTAIFRNNGNATVSMTIISGRLNNVVRHSNGAIAVDSTAQPGPGIDILDGVISARVVKTTYDTRNAYNDGSSAIPVGTFVVFDEDAVFNANDGLSYAGVRVDAASATTLGPPGGYTRVTIPVGSGGNSGVAAEAVITEGIFNIVTSVNLGAASPGAKLYLEKVTENSRVKWALTTTYNADNEAVYVGRYLNATGVANTYTVEMDFDIARHAGNTDEIPEGINNKFFTDAKARNAIQLDGDTLEKTSDGLKVKDAGINTTQLANNSVETDKVANGAVTFIKMGFETIPTGGQLLGMNAAGTAMKGIDPADGGEIPEKATLAETFTGTNDSKYPTPFGLEKVMDSELGEEVSLGSYTLQTVEGDLAAGQVFANANTVKIHTVSSNANRIVQFKELAIRDDATGFITGVVATQPTTTNSITTFTITNKQESGTVIAKGASVTIKLTGRVINSVDDKISTATNRDNIYNTVKDIFVNGANTEIDANDTNKTIAVDGQAGGSSLELATVEEGLTGTNNTKAVPPLVVEKVTESLLGPKTTFTGFQITTGFPTQNKRVYINNNTVSIYNAPSGLVDRLIRGADFEFLKSNGDYRRGILSATAVVSDSVVSFTLLNNTSSGTLFNGDAGVINIQGEFRAEVERDTIDDEEVDTAQLADGAVTGPKIEDLAVTGAKVNNGAITPAKISATSYANTADARTGTNTNKIMPPAMVEAALAPIDEPKVEYSGFSIITSGDPTANQVLISGTQIRLNTTSASVIYRIANGFVFSVFATGKLYEGQILSFSNTGDVYTINLESVLKNVGTFAASDSVSLRFEGWVPYELDQKRDKSVQIATADIEHDAITRDLMADNVVGEDEIENGAIFPKHFNSSVEATEQQLMEATATNTMVSPSGLDFMNKFVHDRITLTNYRRITDGNPADSQFTINASTRQIVLNPSVDDDSSATAKIKPGKRVTLRNSARTAVYGGVVTGTPTKADGRITFTLSSVNLQSINPTGLGTGVEIFVEGIAGYGDRNYVETELGKSDIIGKDQIKSDLFANTVDTRGTATDIAVTPDGLNDRINEQEARVAVNNVNKTSNNSLLQNEWSINADGDEVKIRPISSLRTFIQNQAIEGKYVSLVDGDNNITRDITGTATVSGNELTIPVNSSTLNDNNASSLADGATFFIEGIFRLYNRLDATTYGPEAALGITANTAQAQGGTATDVLATPATIGMKLRHDLGEERVTGFRVTTEATPTSMGLGTFRTTTASSPFVRTIYIRPHDATEFAKIMNETTPGSVIVLTQSAANNSLARIAAAIPITVSGSSIPVIRMLAVYYVSRGTYAANTDTNLDIIGAIKASTLKSAVRVSVRGGDQIPLSQSFINVPHRSQSTEVPADNLMEVYMSSAAGSISTKFDAVSGWNGSHSDTRVAHARVQWSTDNGTTWLNGDEILNIYFSNLTANLPMTASYLIRPNATGKVLVRWNLRRGNNNIWYMDHQSAMAQEV